MPPAKQAHDCRIGDIILYKNEESRIITSIEFNPHKGEAYLVRTTNLASENPRFDTYDTPDEVNVRGTQEALF